MLDPLLRTMVPRVLLQSGGFGREPSTPADSAPTCRAFLEALELDPDGADLPARLQGASLPDILLAQAAADQLGATLPVRQQAWRPLLPERMTVSDLLAVTATALAGKDVLIGVTGAEGHAFIGGPIPTDPAPDAVTQRFARVTGDSSTLAAYQASRPGATGAQLMADLLSDVHFVHPSLDLAGRAQVAGGNVHAYLFDWAPPAPAPGAGHCIDLAFVFGTWPGWADSPMLSGGEVRIMAELSATMRHVIATFIRDGEPRVGPGLTWPTYLPGQVILQVGHQIRPLQAGGGLLDRQRETA